VNAFVHFSFKEENGARNRFIFTVTEAGSKGSSSEPSLEDTLSSNDSIGINPNKLPATAWEGDKLVDSGASSSSMEMAGGS